MDTPTQSIPEELIGSNNLDIWNKLVAGILITLGKAEREKVELKREDLSPLLLTLYDETKTYHDGKWLWIPIDEVLSMDDIINLLKIKRRPNRKKKKK